MEKVYKKHEEKAIKRAFEKIFFDSDRIITILSFLSVFFNVLLGIAYTEIILSIALSVFILLLFYTSKTFVNELQTKITLSGFVFTLWAASFVIVSHGLTETRFIYFIFLFLIAIYQNKQLIIVTFSVSVFIELALYLIIIYKLPFYKFVSEYAIHTLAVTNEQMFWTIFSTIATGVLAYWRVTAMQKNTIKNARLLARQDYQISIFEQNRKFAEEIANGNLDTTPDINEDNKLGKYLFEMKESIKETRKKLEYERFINDYINLGVVEVDNQLRKHFETIEDFALNIVNVLVKYLDACIASFFTIESDENGEFIELKASHAYGSKYFSEKRIEIGEGLVGTAYLEKEITFLTEIPDDYIKIETGIGKSKPGCIVILPLIDASERLAGIIEIASFHVLESYKIKFLENIANHVATAVVQKKNQQKANELLANSQKMANEKLQKETVLNEKIETLENRVEQLNNTLKEQENEEVAYKKELVEKQRQIDFLKREMEELRQKSNKLKFISPL